MDIPHVLRLFHTGFPAVFLKTGHGPAPYTWEWLLETNALNILLAALILGYLIKRFNLFGVFETRQEQIQKAVELAEAEKQDALDALQDVKRRTENLSTEVEEILTQARVSAESLSAQILEEARLEAGKLLEMSKKRIEVEQKAAAKALERRLLADAVDEARSELAGMAAPAQRRSVEEFIERLPALNRR